MSRPSSGLRMSPRSRTQSLSSDRPSTIAHSLMCPPLSVSPKAAFIAGSAASQIVTNDHDSHADSWYNEHGIEPSSETVLVSKAGLQLVNNFLDQLLFNFLSVSRSATLSALRPAVTEVLRPKLAKDAINQAVQELREYLGGDDEDEDYERQAHSQPSPDWDLELVWKRTRLRCMVYSSLGDMEEEDEDYYTEQEDLIVGMHGVNEALSPAVAIFLTSILESTGEQALIVAGQAAFHRMRWKLEKEIKDGVKSSSDIADRIVVEDMDMERVALDRSLGRLWRAWKKKIRASAEPSLTRAFSRDSMRASVNHLRSPIPRVEASVPPIVLEPTSEHENITQGPGSRPVDPANIPLPLSPNELEMGALGLVAKRDDEGKNQHDATTRPRSLTIYHGATANQLPTPTKSQPSTPDQSPRKRSTSLPTPAATPHTSPVMMQQTEAIAAQLEAKPAAEAAARPEASPETKAQAAARQAPHTMAANYMVQQMAKPQVVERPLSHETDEESWTRIHAALDVATGAKMDEPVIDQDESQILTSTISISDRSVSPAASENLPVRSSSVHSLRSIMASPRNPTARSFMVSGHNSELQRSGTSCGDPSVHTTPVISDESRFRENNFALSPHSEGLSPPQIRPGATESRPETEELAPHQVGAAYEVSPLSPDEDAVSFAFADAGYFGAREPVSPLTSTTLVTNDTILPSQVSFFTSGRAEAPVFKPTAHGRPHGLAPLTIPEQTPEVPERSPGRQTLPVFPLPGHKAQQQMIGMVSVDRSRVVTPSGTSAPRYFADNGSRNSPSPSASNKVRAVRASEDSFAPTLRADAARHFEQLIQSDQTIQYTLTPEGVRDMDNQSIASRSAVSASPAVSFQGRKGEGERCRSRSSSLARAGELLRSASISRAAGLRSHPVEDFHVHGATAMGSMTWSAAAHAKCRTGSVGTAREARVPSESVSELAQFLRFTGPNGSGAPSSRHHVGPSLVRHGAGPVSVKISTSMDAQGSSMTSSMTSTQKRTRLQARDAAIDYVDHSDLIDFIRQGPPTAPGAHRIPRTVAPFLTSIDSHQMDAEIGGKVIAANFREVAMRTSKVSTNHADYVVPSVPSSINSQSAPLLKNKPLPPKFGSVDNDVTTPVPKRSTRRVRDPYAIDVSDEADMFNDDDPDPTSSGTRQAVLDHSKEESLVEFMMNVSPPSEPTVEPIRSQEARNRPKRKTSAPSLMARLTRRGGDQAKNLSKSTTLGYLGKSSAQTDSRNLSNRAEGTKGHVPIQVNIPTMDRYGMDESVTPRPNTTMPARIQPIGAAKRMSTKNFEPRAPASVGGKSTTSDLAAFLKDSEPPAEVNRSIRLDESSGLSKVFARRKKMSIS